MPSKNLKTKDRLTAAVMSGDHEKVRQLIDSRFELRQPNGLEYAGVYSGPDGFLDFMDRFTKTYTIESVDITRTFTSDDPDLLIFEVTMQGKLNSSGRSFKTTILEPWQFHKGKVVSITPHWYEMPR
jgi:predicted SnoaL-like aldol condensation-catalyzing enzyme